MVLDLAIARRALIDAQEATKRAERTTRLVQNQADEAASTASADRQRFTDAMDRKTTTIAELEADNARLRSDLTDAEDAHNDLRQRAIGARGTRWAAKHLD